MNYILNFPRKTENEISESINEAKSEVVLVLRHLKTKGVVETTTFEGKRVWTFTDGFIVKMSNKGEKAIKGLI